MRRTAFTLIELLVVMTIIGVVAGLLIPATMLVTERSRWYRCQQRVEEAERAVLGLSRDGGIVALMQERLTLGGVSRFTRALTSSSGTRGHLVPADGAFLTYAQPWQLRFPLGAPSVRFSANGTRPEDGAVGSFDLAQLDASRSADLFVAAGIAPDVAAYSSDRSKQKGWNDPWGNPLIAAIAFFQYGPATAASGTRWPLPGGAVEATAVPSAGFTHQWEAVTARYGYTSAIYVAFGALGRRVAAPYSSPGVLNAELSEPAQRGAALTALWSGILDVCDRPTGELTWRIDAGTNAMRSPPWPGPRQARRNGQQCLLVPPKEYR